MIIKIRWRRRDERAKHLWLMASWAGPRQQDTSGYDTFFENNENGELYQWIHMNSKRCKVVPQMMNDDFNILWIAKKLGWLWILWIHDMNMEWFYMILYDFMKKNCKLDDSLHWSTAPSGHLAVDLGSRPPRPRDRPSVGAGAVLSGHRCGAKHSRLMLVVVEIWFCCI